MLIWHERPSFWALGMHWRTKQSPQCQGTYACWGTILNRLVGEGLFEMTFKKYSNETSKTSIIQYNLKGPHTSYRAGILKLWDLRPANLRWSWCNSNVIADVIIIEIKYTRNVMRLNHLKTIPNPPHSRSAQKLSSTKPASLAKKVGDHCYRVSGLYERVL